MPGEFAQRMRAVSASVQIPEAVAQLALGRA
jgi:hypothetical protein